MPERNRARSIYLESHPNQKYDHTEYALLRLCFAVDFYRQEIQHKPLHLFQNKKNTNSHHCQHKSKASIALPTYPTRAAFILLLHDNNQVESKINSYVHFFVCTFWFLRWNVWGPNARGSQLTGCFGMLGSCMLCFDAFRSAFHFSLFFQTKVSNTTASMGRAVEWGRIGSIQYWEEALFRCLRVLISCLDL